MVLERSVSPLELKRLQDDYSVNMASEGSKERRRGLMVIKKSSLPSKADKRKTAILNWQVCLDLKKKILIINFPDRMLSICISCFGSTQGVSFEHSTTISEGVWFCSLGETQMFPCITFDKCLSSFSLFNKFT